MFAKQTYGHGGMSASDVIGQGLIVQDPRGRSKVERPSKQPAVRKSLDARKTLDVRGTLRRGPMLLRAEAPSMLEDFHRHGPVMDFLAEADLLQYADKLLENGFDDMETLLEMEEADMRNVGFSRGHVLRMRKRLREYSATEENPQEAAPLRAPAPALPPSPVAALPPRPPSPVAALPPRLPEPAAAPAPATRPAAQPSGDPDWALVPAGVPLTPVQQSWEQIKMLGGEYVGGLLFKHLERLSPDATQFKLFPFAKAVSAVGICIQGMHDKQTLAPKLKASGMRHAGYTGVLEVHFTLLQQALMSTLSDTLGSAFTPDIQIAWTVEYSWIASIMVEAMRTHNDIKERAQRASHQAPQQATKKAPQKSEAPQDWLVSGIPMEEVERHNHRGSAWIVVKDRVYDCTPFLEEHPGGTAMILMLAGQDATADFTESHPPRAWDMLEEFFIGPLRKTEAKAALMPSELEQEQPAKGGVHQVQPNDYFLKPRQLQEITLSEKIIVNHDTRIFRFSLPDPDMKLGLPTGQHLSLKAEIDGKAVKRPYTPISSSDTAGCVDLMVKVYFPDPVHNILAGGKMTQHLESMQIGDSIGAKGPFGDFVYEGRGEFTWKGRPGWCSRLSLIAGGSGITLPLQVASAILADPEDNTEVRLLFANRTPDDVLGKWLLDDLVAKHPGRFQVWYTVNRVPEDSEWAYDIGYVNEDMIREHLFPASEDTVCLLCGPLAMCEKVCVPNLLKLGYPEDCILTT